MGPHHHTSRTPGTDEPARLGLTLAIALTAMVMLAEIAGGIWAHSLALLSDAGHMLADLLSLGMALFAVTVAARPATTRKTYGYYRVEILSALINGVVLVAMALTIFYEGYRRFNNPVPVAGGVVLIVAIAGLIANLAGIWLLTRPRDNVNIRCARMHMAGDALSSCGVIVGGLVITFTSWYTIDSLISAGIGVMILIGAYRIIRETVDILLESTPMGIEPDKVAQAISDLAGVKSVHDLHIWSITSGMPALSGHVILDGPAHARSDDILNHIKEMLRGEFGIEHTTIQVESESYAEVGKIHA